jgi:hypothetical protein
MHMNEESTKSIEKSYKKIIIDPKEWKIVKMAKEGVKRIVGKKDIETKSRRTILLF